MRARVARTLHFISGVFIREDLFTFQPLRAFTLFPVEEISIFRILDPNLCAVTCCSRVAELIPGNGKVGSSNIYPPDAFS